MGREQGIDKESFKQIFRDKFKISYPGYNDPYYDRVIEKMLGCGERSLQDRLMVTVAICVLIADGLRGR